MGPHDLAEVRRELSQARGAVCCIVVNTTQVFMDCSLRSAPVDAVSGVFGRDVVSKIPVLVYFLTTPAILLAVAASVPTAIVTP